MEDKIKKISLCRALDRDRKFEIKYYCLEDHFRILKLSYRRFRYRKKEENCGYRKEGKFYNFHNVKVKVQVTENRWWKWREEINHTRADISDNICGVRKYCVNHWNNKQGGGEMGSQ